MTKFIYPLFFLLSILNLHSQVLVNEYSCANVSTITDNFGENEDWIELYNAGATAVDITGYYLSDKPANPTKWAIPSLVLNAGQRRIIWASGRDGVFGGQFHTNFKLTQTENENIVFSDNTGTLLENILVRPNLRNQSTGRTTDGATTWSIFTTPTANASNAGSTAFTHYAIAPTMSVNPGFYPGAQNVALATTEPNSVIRYTTNGSTPTVTSTLYTGPISVGATTVIRAAVFSNSASVLPSFVTSNTYFINVSHSIDVISLFGNNIQTLLNGTQIEPETGLEYFESNGAFAAEAYGESNKHGNDSWAYAQRGIDYISRDQFGYSAEVNHEVFNVSTRSKFQRLILKAAANDNYSFAGGAHIRDSYVTTLALNGGLDVDGRTWEPCIVYVNGNYWGVYDVREKADDKDYIKYYFGYEENEVHYLKTWGATWAEYGGGAATTSWNTLRNFIMTNNMGNAANFATVDAQLNWKSLIDYFCINSYTVCSDWLNWNTAWWRGTTNPGNPRSKWSYVLWDMDATFGHYINYTGIPNTGPTADPCDAEDLPNPGGQGHTEILEKLIDENPMVHQYYVSRYIDLGNTVFSCPNMIHVLDSMLAFIAPEMPQQIARWGGSMAGWQAEVTALKNFINARCVNMEQGIVDCYNVTGPFDITFDVMPAGAGTIQANSLIIPNYPFSGTYYGNIDILLNAMANAGYEFDYWQAVDNVLPTINDSSASIQVTQSQTIIAHFKLIEDPELTFIVDPPLSGNIDIAGFIPPAYPYTNNYIETSNLTLSALAAAGYVFDYWESANHAFNPSTTTANTAITVAENDTIIAHFKWIPLPGKKRLTVQVSPTNSGDINSNGITAPIYPFSTMYDSNEVVTAIALPSAGYQFGYWVIQNHTLAPNSTATQVTFNITQDDTLIAYFVENPSGPEPPVGEPNGPSLAFIPTSFSPNGDGLNDKWKASISFVDYFEIIVFDRWGELVYSSNNVYEGWDGTFRNSGTPCKIDTYTYVINYRIKDQKEQKISGGVTLVR